MIYTEVHFSPYKDRSMPNKCAHFGTCLKFLPMSIAINNLRRDRSGRIVGSLIRFLYDEGPSNICCKQTPPGNGICPSLNHPIQL